MTTANEIKETARQFGADLVGIGSMDRFDGTAPENDPRFIAPQAKSIIGLGFRILRGSLRGIKEGTHYFQYPEVSVSSLDERFIPDVLRRTACWLEDRGYEGVVQRSVPDRRPDGDMGTNPERPYLHKLKAVPMASGKPAPDVLINWLQAAYVCGLGEIGWGGFFLTPEFGPLQRFAFILTDAPLSPDPLYAGASLCDRCGKCIRACPGRAIVPEKERVLTFAGHSISSATLDEWQCAAYYAGAHLPSNPFLRSDAFDHEPEGADIASGRKRLTAGEAERILQIVTSAYGAVNFRYSACICGRACYRACLDHLEEHGRLKNSFCCHSPNQ